jgi:hypothetical protein
MENMRVASSVMPRGSSLPSFLIVLMSITPQLSLVRNRAGGFAAMHKNTYG